MKLLAHIRDIRTGETVVYEDDWDDLDTAFYCWDDGGNYTCDCNRARFFASVKGMPEIAVPCGDELYELDKLIVAETGVDLLDVFYGPEHHEP